jgi:hypothetical protein
MPLGDPARKLAITVRSDIHAKVLRAAKRHGQSVSAWMTEAARRALIIEEGLLEVARWEAQQGAFSDDELNAARIRVHNPSSPLKQRKR